MQVRLHKNATTTPKTRAMIQGSDLPMTVLAERLGVTVETIARWKHRDSVEDRSHTPHRLQTTLSAEQEAIVLVLRKSLDLSLDEHAEIVATCGQRPVVAEASWGKGRVTVLASPFGVPADPAPGPIANAVDIANGIPFTSEVMTTSGAEP